MSFIITQTQDDMGQIMLDDKAGDIVSRADSIERKTSSTVMAACKPLLQMTLDGPGMMATPLSGTQVKKQTQKQLHKGAIQAKSHLQKTRQAKKSSKQIANLDTVDMPNNNPKLKESLRLVSKMQFDDLLRYRQGLFSSIT